MNPLCRAFAKCAVVLASVAALAATSTALAQDTYPSHRIRVIVPYAPGGITDAVARLLMQKLSARFAVPITVENQPGANGQIGSFAASRAAPDGYTFLLVVAAHAINPSLYPKMQYDPVRDLTGVTLIGRLPLFMVSSATLPPKSLPEFVEWAKAHPTSVTFASTGNGAAGHLVAEQFSQAAHITMTHVPYKGASQALPDLITGQVSMIFDSVQAMMPHVNSGKLRALAITSAKRWPTAPDVPTMAESGYPTMTTGSWLGLVAPAKTPKETLEKVASELRLIIDAQDVHESLINYGVEPVGSSPAEFNTFIASESTRWADVIRKANIQLN
jgi:tripartite-type tricarboxylate transporter receptor subunit TctC